MTVGEAIERLKRFDPEAEFHAHNDNAYGYSTEIDDFYESTARYGVATTDPVTVKTVVATWAFAGL